MYLDYEKYKSYGGNLSDTDFGRFSFRAGCEINNATLDRCKSLDETQISEEVKRCEFELIEYLSKNAKNGSTLAVSSFSNDGYSVSFADQKSAEQQIHDIIYTYLANTDLLHCGVD